MRRLYLTYARRRMVFGSQSYGMRSRFLDEIPADLLDEPQASVFRPGFTGAGASGPLAGSARAQGAGGEWSRSRVLDGPPAQARFRLGEDIVHAAFGDGVVTGVEPGGVIVVRFAGDGSERKLMAEYAPVTRR
jgi:DNA helicase-2/ATP-dependent DNA helicase PcrA